MKCLKLEKRKHFTFWKNDSILKKTEKNKKKVLFWNLKLEAASLKVMFAKLYKAVRETLKNCFTPTDAHQKFTK